MDLLRLGSTVPVATGGPPLTLRYLTPRGAQVARDPVLLAPRPFCRSRGVRFDAEGSSLRWDAGTVPHVGSTVAVH